jgi:hypothetical protein
MGADELVKVGMESLRHQTSGLRSCVLGHDEEDRCVESSQAAEMLHDVVREGQARLRERL